MHGQYLASSRAGFRSSYLGSQVEPQVAVVAQRVLDQQWHLIAEAQLHLLAEAARFAEVDKVLERERERDWLAEVDLDVLVRLVDVRV